MKKILSFLFAALAFAQVGNAEDNGGGLGHYGYWIDLDEKLSGEEYMQAYAASMDSLDVAVAAPAGFTYKNVPLGFVSDPNYPVWDGMSTLGPAFESESKEALIAFPLGVDVIPGISPDMLMQGELMNANHNDSLDITNMITIIRETGTTNADWIIRYEYEVLDPKWEGPRHCIGLALRKKNHYAVPIKVFLTDEGLKHKEEYVALALSCVQYGDKDIPECIEKEKRVRHDELKFPFRWRPKPRPGYFAQITFAGALKL